LYATIPTVDYNDVIPYHELLLTNEKLESMIHIYQNEIEIQVKTIDELKEEVRFLRKQLEYKTLGPPIHSQDYEED
tara:strand:+ start:198 stop:425 length:228 start_codon:yes stop_codon:yes gene_type:complete